jgi:alpha-beta hydrolase superfamily lysophospholipase
MQTPSPSRRVPAQILGLLLLLTGVAAAQELVDEPLSFEVEVELEGRAEVVPVEGRLTYRADLPADAPLPGVLLIHGSNRGSALRKDLDGTIPPDKTTTGQPARRWRDLAYALARAGFVVYRHAKRGYALDPQEDRLDVVHTITLARTSADSRKALQTLRSSPRVDPQRVVLVGHSEGTMVAPDLAESDPGVVGLVLLGTVVDFARVVRYQLVLKPTADVYRAFDVDGDDGLDPDERRAALATGKRLPVYFHRPQDVDADGDGVIARAEVHAVLDARFAAKQARSRADPDDYWHGHYRAPTNLSRLPQLDHLPLIVVTGELDWRTPADHARELEAALAAADHPAYEFRYPPQLGHGFSRPLPARRQDYALRETAGPPDPDVLTELGALLAERFLTRQDAANQTGAGE